MNLNKILNWSLTVCDVVLGNYDSGRVEPLIVGAVFVRSDQSHRRGLVSTALAPNRVVPDNNLFQIYF